jgi:3-oxoacyl-[acyl-carrier-protein] synthase-1
MAFEDAKFDPLEADEWSMSAITASSSGGNEFGQKEIQNLWGKGPVHVGAYQSIAWFYAATTGQISIRHNMKGPCGVVLSEGAGGLEALQQSRRTIRRGFSHIVSGGLEAPIGPYALACQLGTGMLSEAREPEDAYRPFDARANGSVPGEGGAILLVEEADAARARGAQHVWGEVVGYGATSDGYDMVAPSGEGAVRCMRMALKDVKAPVDYINPHATSTPIGDIKEIEAIREVFGAKCPPISATKSLTGHSLGATGVQEAIYSLLMMQNGFICESANIENIDPAMADMPIVRTRQDNAKLGAVLSNSFGFGGTNASIIFKRLDV